MIADGFSMQRFHFIVLLYLFLRSASATSSIKIDIYMINGVGGCVCDLGSGAWDMHRLCHVWGKLQKTKK